MCLSLRSYIVNKRPQLFSFMFKMASERNIYRINFICKLIFVMQLLLLNSFNLRIICFRQIIHHIMHFFTIIIDVLFQIFLVLIGSCTNLTYFLTVVLNDPLWLVDIVAVNFNLFTVLCKGRSMLVQLAYVISILGVNLFFVFQEPFSIFFIFFVDILLNFFISSI